MFKIISEQEKHFLGQVLSSMLVNFLPQSSIIFKPEMFGPSISLSGLRHLLNICDEYAA